MENKPTSNDRPPFWTAQQIAERHQVHPVTVRRWLAEGRIRATRLGRCVRVAAGELERFEKEGGLTTVAEGDPNAPARPLSTATRARQVLAEMARSLDNGDTALADWLATTGTLLTTPHQPPPLG